MCHPRTVSVPQFDLDRFLCCSILLHTHRYADVPKDELPTCESLELTINRALPYWNDVIAPQLREGKKVGCSLCYVTVIMARLR